VICISGVPVAGIAAFSAASTRQFFLRDRELVALAGPDQELASAAAADLTADRVVKEAVLEPIDDERFKTVEGLAELPIGNPM
jgi:hypothetical protein